MVNNNDTQINVLAIIPYRVKPITTGGQKSIALFYDYFSRLVNLTGVTVKSAGENAADYRYTLIPLFSDSPSRYINPMYFFTLKKIIKRKDSEFVMIDHPYFGWLGILLKKFTGIKLIIRSHNIEGLRFRSIGKWWWNILWHYEKWIYRFADIVFFVTAEDRQYAIKHFKLKESNCSVLPFGIEQEKAPSFEDKDAAKKIVCKKHTLDEKIPLLLYSAALSYLPNQQGLDFILTQLNPSLLKSGRPYNILISGSKLPEQYHQLKAYAHLNITFAGFVDDIEQYFTAADIFLNPIAEGGGIKTKAVEALAADCTVISFENGAIGIPKNIAGKKLEIVANNDADAFANTILNICKAPEENIPAAFFDFFSWERIVLRAKEKICQH